jgi:aldose 1-epimerase
MKKLLFLLLLAGCAKKKPADIYFLFNDAGDTIKVTTYGGIITHWITKDKYGNKSSVVLGFDSLEKYKENPPYFGAIVGRYANRIKDGKFRIDSTEYQLAKNNGNNALHGGIKGFDKVVWTVDSCTNKSIYFSYLSKDGEEGYPGNLKVNVSYTLTEKNALIIEFTATTDKPTIINLTNHSYFNLTGDPSRTILDHFLKIDASKYTPVDSTLIPTGELAAVTGTPFDFIDRHVIGERITQVPGGYDHNFVLNNYQPGDKIRKVAELSDTISGRSMDIYTSEPGLQFYTGNFLDGKFFRQHTGLCLETQHYPNSPNEPAFPGTVLRPGEVYRSRTVYSIGLH